MENTIKELETYLHETYPESLNELQKLNNLNMEIRIVAEHSDEKITFHKALLLEYIELACKYKLIEGFNNAILYLKDKYSKELSVED